MRGLAISIVALGLLAAPAFAQEPRTDRGPQALTGRDETTLTVFLQPALSGAGFTYTEETGSLTATRIQSLRTINGPWQVCNRHDFQGECRIVEGRYMSRSQIGLNEIRSLRPVRNTIGTTETDPKP